MDSISRDKIINETSHAYLVTTVKDKKNWICWIPKDILDNELRLLDSKQDFILIMRQHSRFSHHTTEIKIYAKYFMETIA